MINHGRTPGDVFRRIVKDASIQGFVFEGHEFDIAEEVAIDKTKPLSSHLEEQPERVAAWYRIRALAMSRMNAANDHYEEISGQAFAQVSKVLEEEERKEYEQFWLDEKDDDHAPATDMFSRKRSKSADRVAAGPRRRYRRDFTDAYVGGLVNMDERVQEARDLLRKAKSAYHIVDAVCKAIDHRMTCLNQLAAMANRRDGM